VTAVTEPLVTSITGGWVTAVTNRHV